MISWLCAKWYWNAGNEIVSMPSQFEKSPAPLVRPFFKSAIQNGWERETAWFEGGMLTMWIIMYLQLAASLTKRYIWIIMDTWAYMGAPGSLSGSGGGGADYSRPVVLPSSLVLSFSTISITVPPPPNRPPSLHTSHLYPVCVRIGQYI